MPNLQTYHKYKNIYSVDMMISYIHIYGHEKVKLPIDDFIPQLKEKVWGDWSPMDVIEKFHLKKYKEDAERIQRANLTYPVIITGKHDIVDGYHRVAKAFLDKKKYVDVYIFDTELMNKFIINKDMDFVKVHKHTSVHEILELWAKRFCN